jgi:hypothetical protein
MIMFLNKEKFQGFDHLLSLYLAHVLLFKERVTSFPKSKFIDENGAIVSEFIIC